MQKPNPSSEHETERHDREFNERLNADNRSTHRWLEMHAFGHVKRQKAVLHRFPGGSEHAKAGECEEGPAPDGRLTTALTKKRRRT